jgi:hypothetical protein
LDQILRFTPTSPVYLPGVLDVFEMQVTLPMSEAQ